MDKQILQLMIKMSVINKNQWCFDCRRLQQCFSKRSSEILLPDVL